LREKSGNGNKVLKRLHFTKLMKSVIMIILCYKCAVLGDEVDLVGEGDKCMLQLQQEGTLELVLLIIGSCALEHCG
jgi:hypothetical protein